MAESGGPRLRERSADVHIDVLGNKTLKSLVTLPFATGSSDASASVTIQTAGFNQVLFQQSFSNNSGDTTFFTDVDATVGELYEVEDIPRTSESGPLSGVKQTWSRLVQSLARATGL